MADSTSTVAKIGTCDVAIEQSYFRAQQDLAILRREALLGHSLSLFDRFAAGNVLHREYESMTRGGLAVLWINRHVLRQTSRCFCVHGIAKNTTTTTASCIQQCNGMYRLCLYLTWSDSWLVLGRHVPVVYLLVVDHLRKARKWSHQKEPRGRPGWRPEKKKKEKRASKKSAKNPG
jgi:hypothetical protein